MLICLTFPLSMYEARDGSITVLPLPSHAGCTRTLRRCLFRENDVFTRPDMYRKSFVCVCCNIVSLSCMKLCTIITLHVKSTCTWLYIYQRKCCNKRKCWTSNLCGYLLVWWCIYPRNKTFVYQQASLLWHHAFHMPKYCVLNTPQLYYNIKINPFTVSK